METIWLNRVEKRTKKIHVRDCVLAILLDTRLFPKCLIHVHWFGASNTHSSNQVEALSRQHTKTDDRLRCHFP